MGRFSLVAVLTLKATGCGSVDGGVDSVVRRAVLNGDDNRMEVFEVAPAIRAPLTSSSAALFYSNHVRWSAPDSVSLRADSAASVLGLCPDERFASEPSAAFCSGVLIDDDLIATAGHCLGADAAEAAQRCPRIQIVFGYGLSVADELVSLHAEQVFSCRKVVAYDSETFAVLQLDRIALPPLVPAPLASRGAQPGDALVVASYGVGFPLKVELQASVTAVSEDSSTFTVAADTFSGSSGGGLFTQALALAGLMERGDSDWEVVDGCARARHSAMPAEQAQQAAHLRDAVCAAGWPSERLCGTSPVCGDGLCNSSELDACSADCSPPGCGDQVCEPAERGNCDADCARYDNVPSSWLDDPEIYRRATAAGASPGGGAASSGGCAYAGRSDGGFGLWGLAILASVLLGRRPRVDGEQ